MVIMITSSSGVNYRCKISIYMSMSSIEVINELFIVKLSVSAYTQVDGACHDWDSSSAHGPSKIPAMLDPFSTFSSIK